MGTKPQKKQGQDNTKCIVLPLLYDLDRDWALIGLLHVLVFQQIPAGAGKGDATGLQYIAQVRDLQGHVGVLLDEQHGDPLLVDLLDDLKDPLDHQGGQPQGGLIHHDDLRPGHEGPGHGQHLLLTAGQGARRLPGALLQPGKQIVHPVQVVFQVVLPQIGPDLQILHHRQVGKHPASLGDQGDPLGDDAVGGQTGDVLPLEMDAAVGGLYQPGDGAQGGGLACSVGADQGDDLPLGHFKGDALYGLDTAIAHLQFINLQHRLPPPNMPR